MNAGPANVISLSDHCVDRLALAMSKYPNRGQVVQMCSDILAAQGVSDERMYQILFHYLTALMKGKTHG